MFLFNDFVEESKCSCGIISDTVISLVELIFEFDEIIVLIDFLIHPRFIIVLTIIVIIIVHYTKQIKIIQPMRYKRKRKPTTTAIR